jgi:DNA-binding MarR family transcriptional regulator
LEAAGFVERLPDPTDRRVVLIGLTEKGTEEAEGLMADVQEKLIGLVNYLGEENSKTLIHLMSLSIEYFASQLET